ncbi:hypothetical protein F511_15004 [Dorcoceras hygrometricum]|uniref:Uncharacterized protein n=1 Tax=Dorcoceras hygrometricum TaxID=472368 RepID=A0A2Z7CTB1_9LAMI|nr:hypothetical protein F511_15004 [Dorcoceras hygrometricum]
MESAVMTSVVMSSQSTVGNQQMKEVKKMKRRRAEESADGLALITSSVTSSKSADGLSPAVARYQQQMLFALINQSQDPVASFIDPDATQRFPDAVIVYLDARR